MAPGQRKLRDSCDACHIAKVKCIKTETGECLRCVSSSTPCSFSPSDRRGKPRGAKNKCNRVAPQNATKAPKVPEPVSAVHTQMQSTPNEAYPSPGYEMDRYFGPSISANSHSNELTSDAWALLSTDDFAHAMVFDQQDDAMSSMFQNECMDIPSAMLTAESQMPHDNQTIHTLRHSISSPFSDPMISSPAPFGPQDHDMQMPYQDADTMEVTTAAAQPAARCKCAPVTLQSLYDIHGEAITTSNGSTAALDVALFINNQAIERCHEMLSCTECVLSPDMEKSSTNMLMLAGTMDDILASYGTTCVAYLDGQALDPLVLSSGSSTVSSLSGSPQSENISGISSRTQSMSSQGSVQSSSRRAFRHRTNLSSQFSFGTYRVGGEDGRHLKLEILKIELRKMERLWAVFRDVCAHQRCQDDQKSLHAALVCYLAKKLRSTADLLESKKRTPGCGW